MNPTTVRSAISACSAFHTVCGVRAAQRDASSSAGSFDRLIIEIPKGTYVPEWRWRQPAGRRTPGATPSIAVLPFANLTQHASDDYFSDGLTDELIHVIGRTSGLRVVARTSVFFFKGKADDVRTIGARLGASLVLEGSVRRSDDRVRIAAHLIDATDGCEIWTGAFERSITDVMRMPMYEVTCQRATLDPPPAQMLQLIQALAHDQHETDRFLGVDAGTVPVSEFYAPENISRIIAAATSNSPESMA